MRRLAALSSALLVGLFAVDASAFPLLSLRPGSSPFEGPTDADLSAIWWNPAALGQLRGVHLGATGSFVLQQGSVARDPICDGTGLPPGTSGACAGSMRAFPKASILGRSGVGLGGISWDFRTENLTVALAVYAPWETHRGFSSTGGAGSTGSPTAYHLRNEDFTTVYVGLGAAFRLGRTLHLGVNVAVADSWADLSFDRDTALDGGSATASKSGYENADYAQRIRVRGSGGNFWSVVPIPSGLSLSIGALWRPRDNVFVGLSWMRMFPIFSGLSRYSSGSQVDARVTPSAASGATCPDGGCVGGDLIEYDIPDVYHLGVRVGLTPTLELSSWLRVVVYGGYQRNVPSQSLIVHLSGDAVSVAGAPSRIVLGRSMQPTVAAEIGLRWRPRPSLRIGASVIAESGAVPSEMLSAESMDAPKLDGMVGMEWRAFWKVRLMLGYEITGLLFSSLNTPQPGAFDPGATVRCVDARYSLDACGGALRGEGLPTASGQYSLVTHHFSAGIFFDF